MLHFTFLFLFSVPDVLLIKDTASCSCLLARLIFQHRGKLYAACVIPLICSNLKVGSGPTACLSLSFEP